ncbi:sirohydrochlorin cobaltochelatase [Pelosinus sp. IPA-1]|uniref:sirohydrochlorin cobaltochelatase n=1 Tax=Pelosinus sp. IPA-1 TaxID=3029569 RepID=UPI0024361D19|nr:sirohydrochlorin cobaltochelatase [Pelosinus sp. IPA-1]GMA97523.1 sirohydrochlorin cobaltochelatase [Pelosinus sp. IPA-1]
MMKKAILVVSFGTTYQDGLRLNIESVENKIRATFPEYEVRRAFTSRIVIKRLAARDGIQIDTETEAIQKLEREGYKEVYIQPLHVVAGEEYDKIKRIVVQYAHQKEKHFDKIVIGRPLLYYTGQEEKPDDYLEAIQALKVQLPEIGSREAVVFMGHGGIHPANTAYAALQMKMEAAGLENVFVYTVEGFPSIENVIDKLTKQNIKKVTLMPFMLVAGDHVNNDMAGDEEDSAKSQLLAAGFEVAVYLHGLGENAGIQDLYVQHLKDILILTGQNH